MQQWKDLKATSVFKNYKILCENSLQETEHMTSTCCGSFKAMVAKQARQVEIKSCGGFGDRVHLKQHSFTNYQQLHVNTYVYTLTSESQTVWAVRLERNRDKYVYITVWLLIPCIWLVFVAETWHTNKIIISNIIKPRDQLQAYKTRANAMHITYNLLMYSQN